jgi:homoserine kinase
VQQELFVFYGGSEVVKVKVPATSANIGPGFDCLGIALDLYNTIEVEECDDGLHIKAFGQGCDKIPLDGTNLVYSSMEKVFQYVGYNPRGLIINLHNNIPIARGLGSSAACIVGGMVAANTLAGCPLSTNELIKLASQMDGHPDNVVPAMLGGMTIACKVGEDIKYIKMAPPEEVKFAVMIPDFELCTAKARQVIPQIIPMEDAVFNISRTALLIASLLTGQVENLAVATEDRLHQPYRKSLIPQWDDILSFSKKLGARGVFLSGAGPTIIAILDRGYTSFAEEMLAMVSSFKEHWEIRIMGFCCNGVEISLY